MIKLDDKIALINMVYLPQFHTFDVECVMAGKVVPEIKRLNTRNFPNHQAFKILSGMFQISQEVRVWIKDESELKKEGWNTATKRAKTLMNKNEPFSIGKRKGKFLGAKSVRGFVGVTEKMAPYVVVKDGDKYWRFTESEIRFILPLSEQITHGKTVSIDTVNGTNWSYDGRSGAIKGPFGLIESRYVQDILDLLRKAEVV